LWYAGDIDVTWRRALAGPAGGGGGDDYCTNHVGKSKSNCTSISSHLPCPSLIYRLLSFFYGSIYILEQGSIDLTVGGAPTAHLHICTCGLPRSLQYYYHSSGKSQSMLLPALVFQQQIKIHFDQVRTLFVMFK
jgi:hypothetical protein